MVQKRPSASGYGSRFTWLFVLSLMLSVPLWLFYRWLFNGESSLVTVGLISLATAWFWAYLVGYGTDQHTGE